MRPPKAGDPKVLGRVISHYRILQKLGQGGMGEVYLAEDTQLNRKVAIKFLPEEFARDQLSRERLVREARTAATLDHPNICAIYDVGQDSGRDFIVLQYIEGETLAARLKRELPNLREALTIASQIADALNQAHTRGIIHRDIKPENVMLTSSGQVKVLDFGLAKVLGNPNVADEKTVTMLSVPGMLTGTVPYMSPEQVRGEELDCRSDIFSFGAVVYEMLSGRRAFEAKSPAEIISAILTSEPPPLRQASLGPISADADRFIRKCMEKDLALRYQAIAHLVSDLEQIRRDAEKPQVRSAIVATALDRESIAATLGASPISARAAKYIAALAALVLLIVTGAYWSTHWRHSAQASSTGATTANSAAYDAYMRGKVKLGSENAQNTDDAIRLFEQAVAADSHFAAAYAELARAYANKARYFAPSAEKPKLNEDAEVAVDKALAINPNLAEAHFARGLILWTPYKRFPHEQAIQSYRRAIELDPNLDEAHHQLGLVYIHIGLLDKGQQEVEKALAINPGNTLARYRLGVIAMCRAQYEQAYQIFHSTPLEQNPSLLGFYTSNALFRLDRDEEASALIERYFRTYPKDEGGAVTSVKAMILAKAGKHAESEAAIQHAIEIGRTYAHFHHTSYNIASAYALMNQPGEAVKWLQVTADEGFPCYPLFEADSNLNGLRQDPQFLAFIAKIKQQWEVRKNTL